MSGKEQSKGEKCHDKVNGGGSCSREIGTSGGRRDVKGRNENEGVRLLKKGRKGQERLGIT